VREPLDLQAIDAKLALPMNTAARWIGKDTIRELVTALRAVHAQASAMLAELQALEWEGCDPSAMPICYACKRDRPDDADGDPSERHDADCGWLALVQHSAAILASVRDAP
jgi:hypothetical protein